jgi:uncharacterized membrane protein YqjE
VASPVGDRRAPLSEDAASLADEPESLQDYLDEHNSADEYGDRSLLDDVHALIDDGKTYLEAELTFQKTRAAFVADRVKVAVVFGAVAVMLGSLALIGLTVGLIIALAPLLTAWGASALVVALLLLGAFLAARSAAKRWNHLMAAIQGDESVDREPGR